MTTQAVNLSAPGIPIIVQPPPMAVEDRNASSDWDFAYEPVPSGRNLKVTVRCRLRGRGQPLPYDLDEESCE